MSPEEQAYIDQYYGPQNPPVGIAAPPPPEPPPPPPGPNMSIASAPPTGANMSVAPDPTAGYYQSTTAPLAPAEITNALPAIARPIGMPGAPSPDPFGLGQAPPTQPATVKLSPAAENAMVKQASSNMPTGPSAADNAAFEAFKSGQASMPKVPTAPSGGGGASGGGGNSLQKNVNDANKALLGTYDAEKDATRQEGNIKSAHDVILAQRQQELSRLQQEDAAIANAQESHAQDIFESHLNEVQSQLADVRSQKIDPMAWKKGSDAMPFVAVIGGLLGGLYMGATHQAANPFMTELNQEIDRSMKVQQDNIDNGRNAAQDNLNLLQSQRALFKDHQLADLNTRNLYYEAAKTQLAADAADTDSQLSKSEADKGLALISRAQGTLQKQIADHALQVAQAQAAAAASQAREAQKFRIETQLKLLEIGIKDKEADAKLDEREKNPNGPVQRFVATGQDAQGNPTGFYERSGEAAQKTEESRKARAELLAEVEGALAIRKDAGTLGRLGNREGALGLYTPEWQAKLQSKEAAIKAKWNHANQLGTLDAGTERLLGGVVGHLDSVGDSADTRLNELADSLKAQNAADERTSAGERVRKVIGQDGREHIEPIGGQNAPNNTRAVKREPVQ